MRVRTRVTTHEFFVAGNRRSSCPRVPDPPHARRGRRRLHTPHGKPPTMRWRRTSNQPGRSPRGTGCPRSNRSAALLAGAETTTPPLGPSRRLPLVPAQSAVSCARSPRLAVHTNRPTPKRLYRRARFPQREAPWMRAARPSVQDCPRVSGLAPRPRPPPPRQVRSAAVAGSFRHFSGARAGQVSNSPRLPRCPTGDRRPPRLSRSARATRRAG